MEIKERDTQDRRRFIEAATKFAAVLTALGITRDEWGSIATAAGQQPGQKAAASVQLARPADSKAVGKLLKTAIESKNMDDAIKKSGLQLSDSQSKALKSLTQGEIDTLNRVQAKLGNLGAVEGDGYIIY